MKPNSRRRFLLPLVAALACACDTVQPYVAERDLLAASQVKLAAGEYPAAAQGAERLYAGRAASGAQYDLQRYYALCLLADAHVQAAVHAPFLGQESGGAHGGSSAGLGSPRNGDVAHLVAATYYVALAKDLEQPAAKAKRVVEGTKLLPEAFEGVTVETAQDKLDLLRLIALARLGFASSYERDLDNWPQLVSVEGCAEILQRTRLERELVPWVHYTLFRYLKTRNDRDAYQFGANARLAAADVGNSLPPERLNEIVEWVRQTATRVEFCCQKCRKPFLFDKLRCQDDGTPITSFFPLAVGK